MIQILVLLYILMATPAWAATYYVTKSGSDSNNCTQAQTVATAKLTIKAALGCNTSGVGNAADNMVEVFVGTYTEALDVLNGTVLPSGTSWSHPFTLRVHPGDTVTLTFSGSTPLIRWVDPGNWYFVMDGFRIDGSGVTDSAVIAVGGCCNAPSYIRFQNLDMFSVLASTTNGIAPNEFASNIEVLNSKFHDWITTGQCDNPANGPDRCGYPLYWKPTNGIVRGNEMYRLPAWGVHAYNFFGTSGGGSVYENNIIHDFGQKVTQANGILMSAGPNQIAKNNVVYNGPSGISASGQCSGCWIFNNTLYNLVSNGIDLNSSGVNASVKNNIISNISSGNCINGSTLATSFATNICSQIGDGITVVQSAAVSFNDAPNAVFTAKTGSKGIDGGTNLTSEGVTTDIAGTARPQGPSFDVGAYESASEVSPVSCPATPMQTVKLGLDASSGSDASGNANHITAIGSGNSWVPSSGKYGGALLFGGTAAATIPASSTLFKCNYTLMAWIKPTTTPSTFTSVLAKRETGTGQGYFMYSAADVGYCASSGPIAGYTQGGNVLDCYATAFTPNVWTHYAETYDSTLGSANIKKWINGVNVTSANGAATLADNTDDFLIGGSIFGEFFTGYIDEVKAWNYALSQGELLVEMITPITSPSLSITFFHGVGASGTWKMGASATAFKVQGAP